MRRHWFKHVMAAGALALGLVAGAGSASAEVKFVMAMPGSPSTFQPWQLGQFQTPLQPQLYDRLIYLDHDRKPVGQLATDWSFSDDGKVFTMKLRHDVAFQSGKPLTSADVKRSWEQITQGEFVGSRAHLKPLASLVKEVRTPDDYTVQLVYDKPNPAVFDLLDVMYIVDMDQWADHDTKAIGSGPYRLTDFRPGESLTMKVNDKYWGDKPAIDTLEYRAILDPQALVLALESGSVDGIAQFPISAAKRLEGEGYNVFSTSADGIYYDVLYNVASKGPIGNKLVRQAIDLTINRERFHRIVMGGLGRVACLPYPKTSIAYDAEQDARCEYNPQKAKALLAEAGYPNGFDVEIMTSTQSAPEYTKLAEMMQNDLRQIGVNATITDLEGAAFLARYRASDFEISMHAFGRAAKDPASLFGVAAVWRTDNPQQYRNPKYGELITQAATTVDKEKRADLYHQINDLILDDVFISTVHTTPRWFAHNKKWTGISYTLEGGMDFRKATLAK
jgi:peptide/nickel transport system substrate-binding protein